MTTQKLTRPIIEAAILGFESQREKLTEHIAELRAMLNGRPAESTPRSETPKRRRRKMSAAGRKAIAEAQKARWAKIRGVNAGSPNAARPKRKLSAAGRKAIIAAAKRRWALKRAEAAKATKAAAK